jgi:transposase
MDPVELPADVAQLHEIIHTLRATVVELSASHNKTSLKLERTLAELERAKQRLFGRKAEKVPANQLTLLNLAAPEEPAKPEPKVKLRKRRGRRGHGRRKLPAHIERIEVTGEEQGETTCVCCGGDLKVIGEDRSERLEYIPGHFKVFVVVRKKRACPKCPSEGVKTQPAPPFALERALPADGLLAHIITDKFADHLPLNRQSKRFARAGLNIGTSTMCGWLKSTSALLGHVVNVMRDELVAGDFVQSDGTGLPVLEGNKNQPHRACLWSYADEERVVFEVTRTYEQDHPAKFLAGFKGVLLADGASNYNLIASADGVKRAGCWAHARRKFFEAREANPEDAFVALAYIRRMFAVERRAKAVDIEARQRIRDQELRPLLEEFGLWTEDRHGQVRPSSQLGAALTYVRNQWDPLVVFLGDGRVPAHNNAAERHLRSPVVGRKNWLFAGSEGGAKVAATMFSIVGSCVMNGIDPYDYLRDVLHRLPDAKPEDLKHLTPAAWAGRHGPANL